MSEDRVKFVLDEPSIPTHWVNLMADLPGEASERRLFERSDPKLGPWRNWLAHRTVDPGVAGSSPVGLAQFK